MLCFPTYRSLVVRPHAHPPTRFRSPCRRVYAAAVAHLAELRRRGCRIVLVTGAVDYLVTPLARLLGADDIIGTKLEEQGGKFTGAPGCIAQSGCRARSPRIGAA